MADLFEAQAHDWDSRPLPTQISEGVSRAIMDHVSLSSDMTVMDFGAGTGLVCAQLAPSVGRVLAVDISESMLQQLAKKEALKGKVELRCQDILKAPLTERVELIVSAMAMHHVEDTRALLRCFSEHLSEGGRIALADLDREDGDFHPPGIEGVYHAGFEREELRALAESMGFSELRFVTATVVHKDEKSYPIFLMTGVK